MVPIRQLTMLPYRLLVAYATFFVFHPAKSQLPGAADSEQLSFIPPNSEPELPNDSSLVTLLPPPPTLLGTGPPESMSETLVNPGEAKAASPSLEDDEHAKINKELAEDEERVLSRGEVVVRKKRTFCKSCYPTYSYGYGGGGGCCGACGQCGGGYGGGYIQPVRIKIKVKPIYGYGGYGGGGGCCRSPCGVCGRK